MSTHARYVVQGAAAAALGALLTFGITHRPAAAAAPDTRPEFMLFIMDNPNGPRLSDAQLHESIAAHRAWAQRLQSEGRLVTADKLTDDDGRIVPTPSASASAITPTERIGGYYLIRARDYDEALRIANDGPILKYGGAIQIRMIDRA